MVYEFSLETRGQNFYNITAQVAEAVAKSWVTEGLCQVFCPHTTAGITVNENADPDVVADFLLALDKTFPQRPEFRHAEENSPAHQKASFMGCGQTLVVEAGRLLLGVWQGIYFCEFDGPRKRRFYVKVIKG